MDIGKFSILHTISISMYYVDLHLLFSIFHDNFNLDKFSTIFDILKYLQIHIKKFEDNLESIKLSINKLKHHINNMEFFME